MVYRTLANKMQHLVFSLCVILSFGGVSHAQNRPQTPGAAQQSSPGKETTMPQHARGTFEVKVTPQKPDNKEAETANLERLSIDKEFHGDIEGTSTGEMLASRGEVKGSGGYVAMERVKAMLAGRKGTFVLQHSGTMTHNTPQMSVTVVPDSGTGALAGIAGSMTIRIEEAKHFYDFEYTLPEQH
ncbi:MAG: DUF3224 domain-containing protein [Terriglobales bacterium]